MRKKINFILLVVSLYILSAAYVQANVKEKLITKFNSTNTLSFDFEQKIGQKIDTGNCYIKYPYLMRCEYPKKKKSIIANGKKIAIVKRRYQKIYYYPLKKTPLFHLLNKENILYILKNYEPTKVDSNIIEYEMAKNNSNILKVFFNKNTFDLMGWKTIDSYSNEVSFVLKNIKINIPINNEFFKIPSKDDL